MTMNDPQTALLEIDDANIHTSYLRAHTPRQDGLTIILMHGAGQSSSERFVAFAQLFASSGVSVVGLDFVGHGKTGGETGDNSLALRTKHAIAAIEHWTEATTPLILCGSSMSGHTALRVSAQLGQQVKSLCLLQPAIYAAEAENIFFGPDFTEILHGPESWQSSLALQDAANFEGRVLIVIGTDDKVIPWGVIEALTKALKQKSREVRLDIMGGVGHELPTWIPGQDQLSKQLVEYLINP
jgi:pimeloyl-ACP methyl ester carboxylesterase